MPLSGDVVCRHGRAYLCAHVFVEASDKDVSVYQTRVFLFLAFDFSIDLSIVTSKGPGNPMSTKQGSILSLYIKDSLGPGSYHSQPIIDRPA